MACQAMRVEVPFDALDLSTVDEFARWTRQVMSSPGASDLHVVVLDFRGVDFVMAAGVHALCDLEATLAARGQALAVETVAPIVTRVFEICGVADRWIVP